MTDRLGCWNTECPYNNRLVCDRDDVADVSKCKIFVDSPINRMMNKDETGNWR